LASEATDNAPQLEPFSRGALLSHLCRIAVLTRDTAALRGYTASLAALAEEQSFPHYLIASRYFRGWLEADSGNLTAGIRNMNEAATALRAKGGRLWGSHSCVMLVDALISAGCAADALAVSSEGLAISACTGQVWLDAELHRRRGDALLTDTKAAEQEYRQALGIARDQSAKLFEIRATVGLARLLSRQDKRAKACDLLAPIYAWFTEGLNMPDLREARELLAYLGA